MSTIPTCSLTHWPVNNKLALAYFYSVETGKQTKMPSWGKIRRADSQFANSGLVTSTGDYLEIMMRGKADGNIVIQRGPRQKRQWINRNNGRKACHLWTNMSKEFNKDVQNVSEYF